VSGPAAGPPDARARRDGSLRKVLPILAAGVFALLLFVFLYCPVQDQDVWWHLKAGWYILAHRAVPRANLFDYATDHVWNDLHWMFQIVAFQAWRLAGAHGLVGLKVLVFGAAWAILVRAAVPPGRFLAMFPFLVLGVVASNERLAERPEMFTYLFLSAQLAIVLRWRRAPSSPLLLTVVALQILWANFHALSILGVAVMGAFVTGEALNTLLARAGLRLTRHPPLPRRLLVLLAAATVACAASLAVTPYGLRGALFPFALLRQLDNPQIAIAEFMGPFSSFAPTTAMLAFRIFLAAVAGLLLLSWRPPDPSLLLLALGTLVLAVSARRNVPLFVFAALPVVGAQLGAAADRLRRIPFPPAARRSLGTLAALLAIGATAAVAREAASGRFYARDGLIRRLGTGVNEETVPRPAMDYVMAEDLPGPAFNDIDSGGYFIWRAFPKRLAFIDGRLEARPPAQLLEYSRAFYSQGDWKALDARYRFGFVVLNHTEGVNWRLIERLRADPAWALVHLDPVGLVYARRDGAPPGLVERDEIAPGRRRPPPFAEEPASADPVAGVVRALLRVKPLPSTRQELSYASALIRLGYVREASAPLESALARNPASAYGQLLRGTVADALGDLPRARTAFEEASRLDPRSMEAAFNLGSARLRSGDAAGAVAPLERAIRIRPSFAQAHVTLGVARLASGDSAGAEGPLRRALALEPALADPVYYLGVAARQRGDVAAAARLFAEFLRRPGGNPVLRDDAGRSPGVTK